MCNESLEIFNFSLKTILVENICACRKTKLYFYSVDCGAGAEVSRYFDDLDVGRSCINQSQTNKQKIETEKPEPDKR